MVEVCIWQCGLGNHGSINYSNIVGMCFAELQGVGAREVRFAREGVVV